MEDEHKNLLRSIISHAESVDRYIRRMDMVDVALKMVNPYTSKETVTKQAEQAEYATALCNYIFAAVYAFLLTMFMTTVTLYTVRAVLVLAGMDLPEFEITYELLAPYITYYGFHLIVYTFIITLVTQASMFAIAKRIGGTGTFRKQVHVSSFLTLALALGATIMIGMVFSCLGQIIVISFILFMLYVLLYLHAVMIHIVHGVSMPKAAAVAIIGTVISLALYIGISSISGSVGISEPMINETLSIPTGG